MIHIKRDPNPPAIDVYLNASVRAADGITKTTRAAREREKAIKFFTDVKNYTNDTKLTDKNFSFAVYKDPDLIAALEKVFDLKCAYCESRFQFASPKDIEHFRPKSEINTGANKVKPGYFWLAGEWENLLISCPDCNRSRNHEVPGQNDRVHLGKSTQFPLEDERARIRDHQTDVNAEEPARLLLNPCLDQPDEHLTFDENGLIHPRKINGQESKRGKISIDVYALQRKLLVEERLRVLNDLRFQFEQVNHLVFVQNTLVGIGANQASLDSNLAQIGSLVQHIIGRLNRQAPYLGMLREWIRKTKAAGGFDELLKFNIDPEVLVPN